MKYAPLRNKPVAKFFYKGHHTHPVRRTIIIIEKRANLLVGYELREGNEVRKMVNAPVKSYRMDRIAVAGQLRVNHPMRLRRNSDATTLQREGLLGLLEAGV